MHCKLTDLWLGVSLACLLAACGGSRGESIGSECLVDASVCPTGTVCENGRCVDEEPSRNALSASGRPEGANAAIEWVAEDGVSCVQGGATTCTVAPGSKLTLKAPEVAGFRFAGWYGGAGCSSAEPTLQLVVSANVDCIARYIKRVRVSGVVEADAGDVQARSDSSVARCANGSCEVDRGSTVTLEAPARDGFRLVGWEGAGCELGTATGSTLTLRAEQDTTCEANFVASLTVRGSASGAQAAIQVSSSASAARCVEQLCAVDPGDAVQLSAPAVDGFRFVGFSGHPSCTSGEPTIVVSDVRESITCTASYLPRYTVRGASTGAEPVAVLAAQSPDAFAVCQAEQCVTDQGGTVTLVAPTVAGFRLRAFTGEGCQVGASGASTTLSNVQANALCTADYVRGVAVTGTVLGATEQVVASSTSAGADCNNGGCSIDVGGSVTLTAPTIPDRTFLGWSGDPGCTGTSAALTLENVASSVSCIASYAARFVIAGTPVPGERGRVAASSEGSNARCEGGSCTVDEGAEVVLVAAANDDARFLGWSGGGPCTGSNARLVLRDARANRTCRATFAGRVVLTSNALPDGAGTTVASSVAAAADCDGARCVVDAGSDVNVLALPGEGFRFVSWSGCSTGTSNPLVIEVGAATTCTAQLERLTYIVAATAGAGGSVSARLGDQTCADARCVVPHGESATLSAQAMDGYTFAGWTGCGSAQESPLTLSNVTSDRNCNASFTRMRFTVSATAGTGGTVSASTGTMTCANASCGVDYGGSVTLRATAAVGYTFASWSCGGTSAALTLADIMSSRSCQASFTRDSYAVSATAGEGGSLRVLPGNSATCSGSSCSVVGGGAVSFEAVPSTNYGFNGWSCSVGTPTSSQSALLAFTEVSENHTCVANFRRTRFEVRLIASTGLTVEGTANGACPNNVCTVAENGSVGLLAFSSGNVARIFTGWSGCTTSAPTEVAERSDLAFRSTLSNVTSDLTCTATSEALAVVTAYQDSGTGAPRVTVDRPHSCVEGASGPRESSNATICRVPVSARVVLDAQPPAGRAFSYWQCWDITANGEANELETEADPITISGLSANQQRACHGYIETLR